MTSPTRGRPPRPDDDQRPRLDGRELALVVVARAAAAVARERRSLRERDLHDRGPGPQRQADGLVLCGGSCPRGRARVRRRRAAAPSRVSFASRRAERGLRPAGYWGSRAPGSRLPGFRCPGFPNAAPLVTTRRVARTVGAQPAPAGGPGVGEAFDREKSLERQIRAFHWIRLLAELPGRFAGSPAEREAADRIESWMRDLGVEDVQRQAVPSRPTAGLVLALHLGLAAFACLVGGGFGALLAGLAAVSVRAELRRGVSLLSRALPCPDSLNVVGRAGARHPGQRVVLSAHIDSAQAGWLFTRPVADFFARRASRRAAHAPSAARPERACRRPRCSPRPGCCSRCWLGAEGFLVGAARAAARPRAGRGLRGDVAVGAGAGLAGRERQRVGGGRHAHLRRAAARAAPGRRRAVDRRHRRGGGRLSRHARVRVGAFRVADRHHLLRELRVRGRRLAALGAQRGNAREVGLPAHAGRARAPGRGERRLRRGDPGRSARGHGRPCSGGSRLPLALADLARGRAACRATITASKTCPKPWIFRR